MRVYGALLIVNALVANTAIATETQTFKKTDFAYGSDIVHDASRAVHSVPVPRDVYRNVVRSDLGDLRVFNADGETVPYAIRRYTPGPEAQGKTHTRMLTKIYGKKGQRASDVELRYRRSAQGESFVVYNRIKPRKSGNERPVFYIVATGDIDQAISAMTLRWHTRQQSFIYNVLIEASDDLKQWRPASRDGVIAEFDYGGQMTQRGEIKLNDVKAKFLKITLSGPGEAPLLASTNLVEKPQQAPPEYQWLPIVATRGEPGEYYFDTGGRMPVEQVRLVLPEGNNLLRIRLSSRTSPEAPWRHRASSIVYQLQNDGQAFKKTEIKLYRFHERYLRLQVDQAESVLGNRLPQIEIGWVPDKIVFISRGKPPYTLAYGNREAEPAFHPIDQLLLLGNEDDKELVPQHATAGDSYALGGADLLTPKRELPWKKWILWAVLLLGVVLLGWMASRLMKQLGSSSHT